jgi:hypothetical protein
MTRGREKNDQTPGGMAAPRPPPPVPALPHPHSWDNLLSILKSRVGGSGSSGPRHVHPRMCRELLDGFGEADPLGLHDKADRVTMRAAAEAVESIVVNVERWQFFTVERATALRVLSGACQRDLPAAQRGEPGSCAQLFQESNRVSQDSCPCGGAAVLPSGAALAAASSRR